MIKPKGTEDKIPSFNHMMKADRASSKQPQPYSRA